MGLYVLPVGGIKVSVDGKCGTIRSNLHDEIDQALKIEADAEERVAWKEYKAAVGAVESLVLAHACAGIKVDDPKYVAGLQTALELLGNEG